MQTAQTIRASLAPMPPAQHPRPRPCPQCLRERMKLLPRLVAAVLRRPQVTACEVCNRPLINLGGDAISCDSGGGIGTQIEWLGPPGLRMRCPDCHWSSVWCSRAAAPGDVKAIALLALKANMGLGEATRQNICRILDSRTATAANQEQQHSLAEAKLLVEQVLASCQHQLVICVAPERSR